MSIDSEEKDEQIGESLTMALLARRDSSKAPSEGMGEDPFVIPCVLLATSHLTNSKLHFHSKVQPILTLLTFQSTDLAFAGDDFWAKAAAGFSPYHCWRTPATRCRAKSSLHLES